MRESETETDRERRSHQRRLVVVGDSVAVTVSVPCQKREEESQLRPPLDLHFCHRNRDLWLNSARIYNHDKTQELPKMTDCTFLLSNGEKKMIPFLFCAVGPQQKEKERIHGRVTADPLI